MKIQLWTVGRSNDKDLKDSIQDFTARCNKYFPVEWVIISTKKAGSIHPSEMKSREAELILPMINTRDILVALDENGIQMSSEQLAGFIQSKGNESTKRIVFLIGGAYGLSEEVLERANFKWSLSKLTFPHQLVRLILAEQLYRAFTILKNEKYHHQ